MHGTPGGRITYWDDPTIYERHGLRRLTYDRPGYGESTRHEGRSVADVVDDVAPSPRRSESIASSSRVARAAARIAWPRLL